MSSMWNRGISLSIFGESHGKAIGVVIDKLPAGERIDLEIVQEWMNRRAPGHCQPGSTPRREMDNPTILSGYLNGKTTGTPLAAIIENQNTISKDYHQLEHLFRPGHADYSGFMRYQGNNDRAGGGHFSGRLTAPIVFTGAIAAQILQRYGIYITAHILQIHNVSDIPFDAVNPDFSKLLALKKEALPTLSKEAAAQMQQVIQKASSNHDSVGGIIECMALGVPSGIGNPIFHGIENDIASLAFGIPAVRGITFGDSEYSSSLMGSENNDAFYLEQGKIKTKTNRHGGILGGITTGMPIVFRLSFKPTPSIAKSQDTVNWTSKKEETLRLKGRHDACIVPRAVVIVESVMAIALLSQLLEAKKFDLPEKK